MYVIRVYQQHVQVNVYAMCVLQDMCVTSYALCTLLLCRLSSTCGVECNAAVFAITWDTGLT